MNYAKTAMIGLAAISGIAASSPQSNVADLAWMSGHWTSGNQARWTEEAWMPPRGGLMLGTGRSGDAKKAKFWELLRITTDADGIITYWGAPLGGPATPFKLTRLTANEAVFENPAHDFPTRIAYRREGKILIATVSGQNGANSETWRYTKVR